MKYISAADTAKLLRKALRRAFPGVKFYVRTRHGTSVSVDWMDGPTAEEVKAITRQYESASFDGMIDLEATYDHWLLSDGTAKVAHSIGTKGSGGYIRPVDSPKPHPDAQKVHFMAHYIFENRVFSKSFVDRVAQRVHTETGLPVPEIVSWEWWVGGKARGLSYEFKRGQGSEHYNHALCTTSEIRQG